MGLVLCQHCVSSADHDLVGGRATADRSGESSVLICPLHVRRPTEDSPRRWSSDNQCGLRCNRRHARDIATKDETPGLTDGPFGYGAYRLEQYIATVRYSAELQVRDPYDGGRSTGRACLVPSHAVKGTPERAARSPARTLSVLLAFTCPPSPVRVLEIADYACWATDTAAKRSRSGWIVRHLASCGHS